MNTHKIVVEITFEDNTIQEQEFDFWETATAWVNDFVGGDNPPWIVSR